MSMQLLYETCLCVWLLSYYDAAVDYLSTTRVLPRLVDVIKGSSKEKVGTVYYLIHHIYLIFTAPYEDSECVLLSQVVRVVILTFRNLLSKGAFGAQMVDLGLPQLVQSLKAQTWSDEVGSDVLPFYV